MLSDLRARLEALLTRSNMPQVNNWQYWAAELERFIQEEIAGETDVEPIPELIRCGTFSGEQSVAGSVIRVGRELWQETQHKARLWDELRPLLKDWSEYVIKTSFVVEERLARWTAEHESDLEAL